ncbi:Uncharacterised protein [Mycobacterium tuberculosis]|nr:Uncharacterised protein [Mycobacterium tuberculosis]
MMVVLKVSVPSRGFGSDDTSAGRDHESGVEGFPSPLGVLGLTTQPVAARLPPPLLTWFPSPLGVLGLTTCESAVSTWDSECFRPLSGFWV